MKNGDYSINYDEFKSDNFALGLTILDCALLEFSSDIYLWNFATIDFDAIDKRMLKLKKKVS